MSMWTAEQWEKAAPGQRRYMVAMDSKVTRDAALQAMHDLCVWMFVTGGQFLYTCGDSNDLKTVGELDVGHGFSEWR